MKTELEGLPSFYELDNFEAFSKRPSNFRFEETLQSNPLHASIVALRLIGRIPLSRNKSGLYYFKSCSFWTIYCVVFMSIQLGMTVKVISDHFVRKDKWTTFDRTIGSLIELGLLLTFTHPVVCTWEKSHKIADALNRWKVLQDSFQSVTASTVSSFLLEHQYWGIACITSYWLFMEFVPIMLWYAFMYKGQDKITIFTFTVYSIAAWYVKIILWFWMIFTHSIAKAARILRKSFVEMMTRDPSVARLRLHRKLWFELHSYTCHMTSAVGNTVRAYLTTALYSFYLSVFMVAISFVNNSVTINLFIPLFARVVQIFLLNNCSYIAEEQISRRFIEKIFSFKYQHVSEDLRQEIELFLFTIENSSGRFVLEHMVELSRETLLNILGLALTIMVILLQFRSSSSET